MAYSTNRPRQRARIPGMRRPMHVYASLSSPHIKHTNMTFITSLEENLWKFLRNHLFFLLSTVKNTSDNERAYIMAKNPDFSTSPK